MKEPGLDRSLLTLKSELYISAPGTLGYALFGVKRLLGHIRKALGCVGYKKKAITTSISIESCFFILLPVTEN